MDALEPAQRLHAGGAAGEGPAGRAMRLALVAVLLLAAALIFAAFAWADPWRANELGRLMILEYHKIDYPEERWTRTPENFRACRGSPDRGGNSRASASTAPRGSRSCGTRGSCRGRARWARASGPEQPPPRRPRVERGRRRGRR